MAWPPAGRPDAVVSHPTLLVFARAPEAGRSKTRLAAGIGEQHALRVYHALLRRTAAVLDAWPGAVRISLAGDAASFAASPLAGFPTAPQIGDGLGARLAAGVAAAMGAHGVIAIGSDCPSLAVTHLERLTALLRTVPVVLGPARDGGYWGIALRSPAALACCFADDLPWSTSALLAETRRRLTAAGHEHALGDELDDLDDADDLARAEAAGFTWRPAEEH
jgi:rSAM/selenodomain-associated transferase 1